MNTPNFVPDSCKHGCPPPEGHHCDAPYVLIGEAPGRWENTYKQPFIGPAGNLQEDWWKQTGFTRAEFYITNVYPYQPPANKIQAIPGDKLWFWTQRLHERLALLQHPLLIVPTGNTALRALFGEHRNISDWRGSICEYNGIKVIPTIHPAATFRQPILVRFCLSDWAKIKRESAFPELDLPQYQTVVEPTEEEFGQFLIGLERAEPLVLDGVAVPPAMSVDIECDINTKELLCVGFSYDGLSALVLPLTRRAISTEQTYERMWYLARKLCAHAIPKILQNGQFDAYHLALNRIPLLNYTFDLMELDHAYDPNDGSEVMAGTEGSAQDEGIKISMRNLATLNSLYGNRQPFWKHQGKQTGGYNLMDMFKYNGIDCCTTWACYPTLYARLAKAGMI